jgi:hypothetical protein
MRTTLTIDPDVAQALERLAQERGITFKEAVNTTLRAGLGAEARAVREYHTPSRSMGLLPGIDLDHALITADQLEDDAIARKLALRK